MKLQCNILFLSGVEKSYNMALIKEEVTEEKLKNEIEGYIDYYKEIFKEDFRGQFNLETEDGERIVIKTHQIALIGFKIGK